MNKSKLLKRGMRSMISFVLIGMALSSVVMASCNQQTEGDQDTSGKKATAQVITADEFAKLAGDTNTVILDVRTPEEYNAGHIEGARNMNVYTDFEQGIKSLDKNKTYLLYCQTGRRSNNAMRTMQAAGFNSLYDLKGGIRSWQASGNKVTK